MKFGIRFRLLALGVAMGLMGALIVLITLSSQRQVTELKARLSNVESESSGITAHFETSLRELNSDILLYGTDHDAATWNKGFHTALELDVWLDQQKSVLQTPEEKALLEKIAVAYDHYLHALDTFHQKVQLMDRHSASLADFTPVRQQSQQLFDLGQTLAHTHSKIQSQLLQHANWSLRELHFSVLIMVALLFLFEAAMAVAIYRNLIAPMHRRLATSRSLAESHEKLASLGLAASSVAQEIRTPLTSIKIGMRFQKNKFAAGTPERAEAEVVEQEIQRLEQVLDHFLSLTRPVQPQLAALPLEHLFEELRLALESPLAMANVRLVINLHAPMKVRADAAQIKQVLSNLIHFTAGQLGEGGRVRLNARPDRQVLDGQEMPVVVLEVADASRRPSADSAKTSAPIPVEQSALENGGTGGGVGLTVVAQIIRKNGGKMEYSPSAERGLLFGIILPRV